MQVGPAEANFIVDKVKGQHYQVACGKYFEATHKGSALSETEVRRAGCPRLPSRRSAT